MSGIIIEPATSIEAIERNFSRLNEAVVALQGGSIAIENIEGYENLATKLYVEEEIENVRYAVGDIYISETSEDPKDKFGYGTWQLISEGRALVGVSVDDQDFQAAGQTGGEKKHTLTVQELPRHRHQINGQTSDSRSGGDQIMRKGGGSKVPTEPEGGNQPHNNLQPYYCVYIWKRTA